MWMKKLQQFPGNLLLELEVVSTTTVFLQADVVYIMDFYHVFIIFNYLLHEYFKPAEALQVLCSTIMWNG